MKAILVIDMPTNCRGCDKLVRKGCLKGDYRKNERPKQCPLKEMPEKKEIKGDYYKQREIATELKELIDFDKGYNACIDEITGGK